MGRKKHKKNPKKVFGKVGSMKGWRKAVARAITTPCEAPNGSSAATEPGVDDWDQTAAVIKKNLAAFGCKRRR